MTECLVHGEVKIERSMLNRGQGTDSCVKTETEQKRTVRLRRNSSRLAQIPHGNFPSLKLNGANYAYIFSGIPSKLPTQSTKLGGGIWAVSSFSKHTGQLGLTWHPPCSLALNPLNSKASATAIASVQNLNLKEIGQKLLNGAHLSVS